MLQLPAESDVNFLLPATYVEEQFAYEPRRFSVAVDLLAFQTMKFATEVVSAAVQEEAGY